MEISGCTGSYPTLREIELYPQTNSLISFPDWIIPVDIMPENPTVPNWDGTRFIPLARACP
jgi:hypothetical protein